jgi:hypothetical protein
MIIIIDRRDRLLLMAEFLQLSEHGLALRPNRKANHLLASFKGQNRRLNDLELTEELCKGTVKLTLRLLVSYIYIYIYMEHLFLMFLDHTQRRSTVGRTPLDE